MKHVLAPLPYATWALEPHIDARTMVLHHDQHQAAYVKGLNLALESAPQLQDKSVDWLLLNPGEVPENLRTAVRNNAGGHANHNMLWRSMTPDGGALAAGQLADAIDQAFGSMGKFRSRFEEAGVKLFGSGWVWLVKAPDGDDTLSVLTTSNHDNPMTQGYYPLLVNDVWEHAYYLKHENRRADYLKGWWPVVDWKEVRRRHARSRQADRPLFETNGNGVPAMSK